MAGAIGSGPTTHTRTYQGLGQYLMLSSWAIIGFFLVLPVCIMFVHSFLTKEFRGGVVWEFSTAAYDQFFFDRGLFGDEPAKIGWTYITIFWRSIWQAGMATFFCLIIGFPTAWYIATRKGSAKSVWLFLITIPYWVNLLIRTISMKFLIRDNGLVNEWPISFGAISEPIHMINTNFAVQLGLFYSYLPIAARMQGIEDVYEQAAQDLYATRAEAFRLILLPLMLPGIISGFLLAFIITNFVKGAGIETLPTAIFGAVKRGIEPNIMAISTLLLLVSVAFVTLSYFVGKSGQQNNSNQSKG